jgi:hypothetical protein
MKKDLEKEDPGSLFLNITRGLARKVNIFSTSEERAAKEIALIEGEALNELEALKKRKNELLIEARLVLEKMKVEEIKGRIKEI